MMKEGKVQISDRNHILLDDRQLRGIQQMFTGSSSRIIFLDYDGTLVPFHPDPKSAAPEKEILTLISSLAKDPRNEVVIISGRDMNYLKATFKGIPLSMVSEHGYRVRDRQGFIRGNEPRHGAWKKPVLAFLQSFTNSYEGSFIEEKQASLAFHFRRSQVPVKPEDVRLLRNHIAGLNGNWGGLELLEGKKVLEIKQAGYNKGTAARRFLDAGHYEFILAAGDDTTDEALFMAMPEHAVTVRIGDDDSFAHYFLKEQSEMKILLSALSDPETPRKIGGRP